MGKWLLLLLLFVALLPLFAEDGGDVTYTGGTLAQTKEGSVGKLDFADARTLRFVSPGIDTAIPYDRIEAFEHTNDVAVHLGVAPAIAVGLVKRRRRNHFLQITFRGDDGVNQVAVFEIPKKMPEVLMPLLVARSPQARCGPVTECGPAYRPMNRHSKGQGNGAVGAAPQPAPNHSQ